MSKPTKWTEKTHTISYLIRHENKFDVDRNYQRHRVWPRRIQQYLIDTILKGLDIGRLWVQAIGDKYHIIDGQQRLNAIWRFAKGEYPLREEYSGVLGEKKYEKLPSDVRDEFDEYNVKVVYLLDMSDEEIRDIYRRINSGVPLNTAEYLNALPGTIVPTMRQLGSHDYFQRVCQLSKRRYRAYHIAAQIMLLQHQGITDTSPKYLLEFFEKERGLDVKSATYRKTVNVLDRLVEVFRKTTPELGKPGWAITMYLLGGYLYSNYVMAGREDQLKDFFLSFYQDVQSYAQMHQEELTEFYVAISRGTTKKENIQRRHDIIFKRFWEHVENLVPLDPKRDFTREERIAVFTKYSAKCAVGGEDVHDKAWHVHHKKPWIEGGPTTIENAMLLCDKHHEQLHKQPARN